MQVKLCLNRIKKIIENNSFVFAFFALFITFFIWWLAFFPGILTYDSLDQWQQSQLKSYNNWHPFLYAYFFSLLSKIWATPAIVSLIQALLFSLSLAFFLSLLLRRNKNFKIYILTLAFLVISPIFGILTITLWKDVFFTLIVLISGILLYLYCSTEKSKDKNTYLYLAFMLFGVLFTIRHNGFVYLALVPVLLLLLKKVELKKIIVALILSVFMIFLINNLLFNALKVKRTDLPKQQFKLKVIAASYHFNRDRFSKEEVETIKALEPLELWDKSYSCISIDPLTFNQYMSKNFSMVDSFSKEQDKLLVKKWDSTFYRVLKTDPSSYIKDRLCYTPYLLGGFSLYSDRIPENNLIKEESKFEKAKSVLTAYLAKTSSKPYRYFFWGSWLFLLLALYGMLSSFRRIDKALFIYSSYSVIVFFSVVALAPAPDFRYIYPMVITALFIPLMALPKKKSGGD